MAAAASEFTWVFGYGSLIWNPNFNYVAKVPAVLNGSQRNSLSLSLSLSLPLILYIAKFSFHLVRL